MLRLLLSAALACLPALAAYTNCTTVTFVNHPASTLTNFPVLVCANGGVGTNCDKLAHTNLFIPHLKSTTYGGTVTSSFGYDVGFFSDASCTMSLDYELVPLSYVASTGFGEWWVNIPSLDNMSDTVIYIGIGDASVTTDQSSTATWPAEYLGRWHLPNGSALTAADSTSNGSDGTINTVSAVAAKIDGGASFVGTGDITAAGVSISLNSAGTWACWINPSSSAAMAFLGDDSSPSVFLYKHTDDTIWMSVLTGSAATKTSTTVTPNAWSFVAGVANTGGPTPKIYINGAEASYSAAGDGGPFQAVSGIQIGTLNGSTFRWSGTLDECFMTDDAKSSTYIAATYANMLEPWNYYTFGSLPPLPTSVKHRSTMR